jgi:ABC-type lipoprotein export system ATPase subunit
MHPITTKTLTHIFDNGHHKVTAVDQVNLNIEKGEFIALTGRSGSGKSTLLYHLACLLQPTSGTLQYGETDPFTLSHSARNQFRAQNIGILYPDFRLLPYLNIADNIATPALALRLSKKEITTRTNYLIEQFALTSRASHLPSALSSGEQQRTALARALFTSPATIIADEPTGNLDETNSLSIIETLKNYTTQGNTVIIATHDPLIIQAANRTLTMQSGSLTASIRRPSDAIPIPQ